MKTNWRETFQVKKSWQVPPPEEAGVDKAKINDLMAYEVAGKLFMELFEKLPDEVGNYITPGNPNLEHISQGYVTAQIRNYLRKFVDDINEEDIFAEAEE
jgi:hypothetical protein